jgi:hypothetical protein
VYTRSADGTPPHARQNLHAFRLQHPQYFGDTSAAAPVFRRLCAVGFMAVLPAPAPSGHRVICSAPAQLPEDIVSDSPELVATFGFWLCERLLHDPHVQVHGLACLVNYGGLSFSRFATLSGMCPLRTRLQFQNCFAARYGTILIFSAPSFLAAMFALVRPLLPSKISGRMRFVGDAPGDAAAAAAELVPDAAALPSAFAAGAAGGDGSQAATAWLEEQLRLEALGR